jgi:hypothetical protein
VDAAQDPRRHLSRTKVGRHVRTTEQQITDALAALEIGAPDTEDAPRWLGITPTSPRRGVMP